MLLLCFTQTKCAAAGELEHFRQAASDEGSRTDLLSAAAPTSLAFTAPPPPPAVVPQGKPATVAHPSGAAAAVDPALAREVMLEAIRSGCAAERLKKVEMWRKETKSVFFFTEYRRNLLVFHLSRPFCESTVMRAIRPSGANYMKGATVSYISICFLQSTDVY